jgi:hypothetical protein
VLPRDGEAREILARENLMGKRRNQHPQQLQDNQDSIFAGNPFLDDLLAWRHSPEGEQFAALTLANSEQAYRPRGMRNMGSLSTIS